MHKITRIVLFLTSFSWTYNILQDYMAESTPLEKITTRMLPMLFVAAYCVLCPYRHMLKRMFRPGMLPLLFYVTLGVICGLSSAQMALCFWKGMEILITMMWICVSCRDKESTKNELIAITGYVEVLLAVTVVLAVVNPALGTLPSATFIPWIKGYLPLLNPNTIGFLSVVALTRLLFLPAKHKLPRLALVSGTLLCAQSRTSYLVIMVAFLIFFLDSLKKKRLLNVVISSGVMILALFLQWDGWIRLSRCS